MTVIDTIQLTKTFIAYGQYSKAEALLQRHLQQESESLTALDLLISVCRIQGKLHELSPLNERLSRLCRGSNAALNSEKDGAKITLQGSPSRAESIPAPHLMLREVLSQSSIAELLDLAAQHREQFRKAKTKIKPAQEGMNDRRNSLQFVAPFIYEKLAAYLGEVVRGEQENCRAQFAIPAFAIDHIEYKYGCYPNGSYFRVHRDDSDTYPSKSGSNEATRRRISFAYYFHRLPRSFCGGDLLLHDTDRLSDRCVADRYLKITPENNTLVFFPSCCFHQVTEVSEATGDMLNGRFAINGHICSVENTTQLEVKL